MTYLRAFARFWWGFVVGDDWRVALGVVGVLAAGGAVAGATDVPDAALAPAVGAALILLGVGSILGPARRRPDG